MATAFLLGAGASKDAGLPLACEITKKVLNDEYKLLASEVTPGLTVALETTNYKMCQCILRFLHRIRLKVECAFTDENHATNYEDLAYMAGQILDHLRGNFENPAICPLIKEFLSDPDLLPPSMPDDCPREELEQLSTKAIDYIHKVVKCAVTQWPPASALEYLRFLIESPNNPVTNIFTLNNDTLVEQFLLGKRKNFNDGFDPPIAVKDRSSSGMPGMACWKPELLIDQPEPGAIRLFKLHGSVNWFCCRPNASGRAEVVRIGITNDALKEHQKAYRKLPWKNGPDEEMPQLLIGTFNKMLSYTNAPYLPLYYGFYRQLEATDRLIVCGYSFGDKGVNQQIVNWMDGKSDRRMVVVDACTEEKLREKARGAILIGRNRWDARLRLFLETKLKCVDWCEIW